jgi:hypothetical protein
MRAGEGSPAAGVEPAPSRGQMGFHHYGETASLSLCIRRKLFLRQMLDRLQSVLYAARSLLPHRLLVSKLLPDSGLRDNHGCLIETVTSIACCRSDSRPEPLTFRHHLRAAHPGRSLHFELFPHQGNRRGAADIDLSSNRHGHCYFRRRQRWPCVRYEGRASTAACLA